MVEEKIRNGEEIERGTGGLGMILMEGAEGGVMEDMTGVESGLDRAQGQGRDPLLAEDFEL